MPVQDALDASEEHAALHVQGAASDSIYTACQARQVHCAVVEDMMSVYPSEHKCHILIADLWSFVGDQSACCGGTPKGWQCWLEDKLRHAVERRGQHQPHVGLRVAALQPLWLK